ncbi:Bacillopeptidase F [Folsomia candida]|uniref:Bacillopeptidase F n=1 Tax=Folsomia candida TaxID=158441 RepID=A0A226EAC5_FOLCA|nr:Bacillopeptidase F [Folsomia candida]
MKPQLFVLSALVALASAGVVDLNLKRSVEFSRVTEAIIEFPQVMDQIKGNVALQSLSGDAKVSALVASLRGLTSAAQAPLVAVAKSLGLTVEQYWVSNVILVKGLTLEKLSQLTSTPGDFLIRAQGTDYITDPITGEEVVTLQNPQWGVAKIRANLVWSITQGEGVVVGIFDSGVNLGHEALSAGYAGAWLDPHHNEAAPTDVLGHGSHVAGTVLGRANGIGVAPGAQWTACRGFNHTGNTTEALLLQCGEFFLTSTPRPNVVCNSWGGPQANPFFRPAVEAWRQAGIIPVFAMGNSGRFCRTVSASANMPEVIAVGATNDVDGMGIYSSRGPTSTGLNKPEVSAPGTNVISCGTGASNYVTNTGTSMATPHVAGSVALLLSANPTWGSAKLGAECSNSNEFEHSAPSFADYSLLGSSGCGKTTLLSCIVGIRKLNSGEITVFGGEPGSRESGIPGKRVGFMPQENSLYNDFN